MRTTAKQVAKIRKLKNIVFHVNLKIIVIIGKEVKDVTRTIKKRNISICQNCGRYYLQYSGKEVYCELRSNGVNINKVATIFGGGGHLQASGCTLKSLEQVKEVLKELNKVAGDSYEK